MAYSYSAIKQYEQCPAQYKFNRIDKLPQPTGAAASRGTMIHNEIENLLNGSLMLISDEVQHLMPKIESWINLKAQPEMKFAVDKDWKAVAYDDTSAWFRGVIDLYIEQDNEATVLDFKTGKDRDYADQVSVYASVILATKPHIDAVNVGIEFIDLKKYRSYNTITRSRLSDLQTDLSSRIGHLQSDNIYAANPSGLCRFCHYRKDNGGPCKW